MIDIPTPFLFSILSGAMGWCTWVAFFLFRVYNHCQKASIRLNQIEVKLNLTNPTERISI